MSADRAHATRGFTLLEVTVTLAILGLVLSIVYGVFARVLSAKDLAEERADRAAAVRAALANLSRDLTLARPRPGAGSGSAAAAPSPPPALRGAVYAPRRGLFLGQWRAWGDDALYDLAFSAFLRRPTAITFAATDLGIVHYFVAPLGDDPQRLGLYREALFSLAGDVFDPDETNPEATMLVLPHVLGFELRFFDGKDWQPEWDSTDARRHAPAPLAVDIALTVGDEAGRPETYRTAIDLPMAPRMAPPRVAAGGAAP